MRSSSSFLRTRRWSSSVSSLDCSDWLRRSSDSSWVVRSAVSRTTRSSSWDRWESFVVVWCGEGEGEGEEVEFDRMRSGRVAFERRRTGCCSLAEDRRWRD